MHLSHFAPSKIPRFAAKKNITQKTRFHTQKHQKIVNVQNGISMREKSNCLYYNGEFLKVFFFTLFFSLILNLSPRSEHILIIEPD